MRLADLKPKWIGLPTWALPENPFYIGVSFLCPHCEHTDCPECGQARGKRLAVMFDPPIDPTDCIGRGLCSWPQHMADGKHKRLSGMSFDDLTLDPSVGFHESGHWHGTITNGELFTISG